MRFSPEFLAAAAGFLFLAGSVTAAPAGSSGSSSSSSWTGRNTNPTNSATDTGTTNTQTCITNSGTATGTWTGRNTNPTNTATGNVTVTPTDTWTGRNTNPTNTATGNVTITPTGTWTGRNTKPTVTGTTDRNTEGDVRTNTKTATDRNTEGDTKTNTKTATGTTDTQTCITKSATATDRNTEGDVRTKTDTVTSRPPTVTFTVTDVCATKTITIVDTRSATPPPITKSDTVTDTRSATPPPITKTSDTVTSFPPTGTSDPNNCVPTAGNAIKNPGLDREHQEPWEINLYRSSNETGPGSAGIGRYLKFDEGYKSYDGWTFTGSASANNSAKLWISQNVPVVQGVENTLEFLYKFKTGIYENTGSLVPRIDGRDYPAIKNTPSTYGSWQQSKVKFTPRGGATSRIELTLVVDKNQTLAVALDNFFLASKIGNVNPCPYTG